MKSIKTMLLGITIICVGAACIASLPAGGYLPAAGLVLVPLGAVVSLVGYFTKEKDPDNKNIVITREKNNEDK